MKKSLILLCLLAVLTLLSASDLLKETINKIKTKAKTWKAVPYEDSIFYNWSDSELSSLLGAEISKPSNAVPGNRPPLNSNMPSHFDARDKWTDCIGPVRDQAHCGSCWAFATAQVFSDRLCLGDPSFRTNLQLSVQELISCSEENDGCRGGVTYYAFQFIQEYGIVSEKCYPYLSGDDGDSRMDQCHFWKGECELREDRFEKFYCTDVRYIQNDVDSIKWELMMNGPVTASFQTYLDFFAYKEGIYEVKTDVKKERHAVKIIGWGEEKGVKYWIAANSWGPEWGENGFFRIKLGESEFESFITFAAPTGYRTRSIESLMRKRM